MHSYNNWRRSWALIVPGKFGAGPFTDLLFYDQGAGVGEFYATYLGNITLLQTHNDWRHSWHIIVPGTFSPSPWTSLLFYDQGAGVGEFYAADGAGGISLLSSYADWRKSWTHILPGNFGGPQTGLLFYDSNSGDLELYQVEGNGSLTDGLGNYAPFRSYPGWGAGWTHIIPGQFGSGSYTNLLFYNVNDGSASFFTTDGAGNLSPLTQLSWDPHHTQIVPGVFGGYETDLIIYDSANNRISVFLEYQGGISPLVAGDLPSGVWTDIIPGRYSNSGYTDLLFYDVNSGIGSFYWSETPVEWQTGLIQGYAGAISVFPGEVLTLHVSSRVATFALDILRRGMDEQVLFQAQGASTFLAVADDAYENGCGWPSAFDFNVPADWKTGLYTARITASDGTTNDVKDMPFVVKAPSGQQNKLLCVLPFATIQAYNRWGGRGLYGHAVDNDSPGAFQWTVPRAFKVSFDRPTLYISPNLDDPNGTDVEWRWVPFIKWLENNGFAADYCTSVDLHANATLLNPYNLVLSIGHDEYWSKEMRDNVEAFAATGGNVAFFSGNTCWWQVRFEDNNRAMICYKDAHLDPMSSTDPTRSTVNWYDVPVSRPENSMTGVSWRYGAIRPANISTPGNFVVRNANHWVFAGTGLNNGDQFGTEVLVSSETDAALYIEWLGVPRPIGQDGTPLNFVILATADLSGWDGGFLDYGNPRATMGLYQSSGIIFVEPGTVFTAATTDWPRGLTLDVSATPVDIITTNVVTRLSARHMLLGPKRSTDWKETVNRRVLPDAVLADLPTGATPGNSKDGQKPLRKKQPPRKGKQGQ